MSLCPRGNFLFPFSLTYRHSMLSRGSKIRGRRVSVRVAGKQMFLSPLLLLPAPSSRYIYGPRPLKSTGRHGHFLNSTWDIRLSNMRQGLECIVTLDTSFSKNRHVTFRKINDKDMRHCHFLKSTCDVGDTPSRAPGI